MDNAPVKDAQSRRSAGLSPLERVLRYHDETKHQFMQYARSLGFLDWANQPDPFRRYDGAPWHELPLLGPPAAASPTYDDLFVRGQVPAQAVTVDTLSRFLEYALSITAWKQAGDVQWALRSNPSSGNLHPTEGYLILRGLPGLAPAPAVYHYRPKEHGLERRATLPQAWVDRALAGMPADSFLFGLTSIHWREAWKYGERAFRYCQHDVGHALASARVAAAALGWRMVLLSGVPSEQLSQLLGIGREQDYQDHNGAEREHPDCLCVVWPDRSPETGYRLPLSLPEGSSREAAEALWSGRANRLSQDDPLRWDIIDEVAESSLQTASLIAAGPTAVEGTPTIERDAAAESALVVMADSAAEGTAQGTADRTADRTADDVMSRHPPTGATAHQIIHQRRSAVAFDGRTSMASERFFRLLARVTPQPINREDAVAPPWDLLSDAPRVHLLLFVHLVEGLSPGLYCLVRNPEKQSLLRDSLKPDFLWTRPPACPPALPLYCLAEGDARRVAAQVSCHQDIAGASAFALGMLAEFEEPLRCQGPGLYPRLFWECGVIGQLLYLEAEAAGLRGTGIGCFFDDPVHQLFGLEDRRFQSLYHFTIGGPVDDGRLTTLPPYPTQADRDPSRR